MKSQFKCYIEGSPSGWEAICTDLDISVTGSTFDETRCLLQTSIYSYVQDALQESEPARTQLLHRRAPWNVRLSWYLRFAAFRNAQKQKNEPSFEGRFSVPCPA